MSILLFILYGIVCGAFCAYLAKIKGYDATLWFIGGFFLGIFALITTAGLPVKEEEETLLRNKVCPDCAEQIKISAKVCKYCGFRYNDSDQSNQPATQPATQPTKQHMVGMVTCPACGSTVPDGLQFCTQCGNKIITAKNEEET